MSGYFEYPKTNSTPDSAAGISEGSKYMTNADELRIVMIGRTGCGKSATGNTILGEEKFNAMVSGSSVTANCSRGETLRDNRLVLIVDTPGLFDTNRLNAEVTGEIGKCIGLTSPGPHAVLLVIGIGRYTQEEQDTVNHFLDHFGSDVSRYMMIVFTKEDALKRDKKTIEEFLKGAPQSLKEIVKQCNNRYIAMDNTADEATKRAKVSEIISKIDKMVKANGGECYTNATYKAAEEILARRMEQIRAEFEQDRSKQMFTIGWQKDDTEKEKLSIQQQIAELKSAMGKETDANTHKMLSKRIKSLRQRESCLNQELQLKERQTGMLKKDLEIAKQGKENDPDFNRTVRKQVRDDVEQKNGNIFTQLLDSIKKVGKTFLSKAIDYFTKKLF